jgi:hypothetical protein
MNQHGIFEGDEFSPTKNVFHSNFIAARRMLLILAEVDWPSRPGRGQLHTGEKQWRLRTWTPTTELIFCSGNLFGDGCCVPALVRRWERRTSVRARKYIFPY